MSGSSSAPGPLPPGYTFVRELGRGGNGWVALAHQVSLDRLVAVKSIDATIPDEAAAGRLRREGRVVAALRHPSIVTVYEMLVSSAGVALVMEFVPGGDLRHAIDSGWLSGSHAAAVLCDVAAALEHAHQRGIVHRDVKPANVLLSPGGRAKLADFGLARLPRSSDGFRTIAGGVAGTPMYLAPEQIVHPDFESPTIDAYSFAVLCYEVLTGAKPFAATTMPALVYAHLHQAPLPLWRHAPELPVPVGEILLAGLAKNPDQRPSPARRSLKASDPSPPRSGTDSSVPSSAGCRERAGIGAGGDDGGAAAVH